ncbi:type II toxin-antitoxin system Rv0910 family toxin [Nocardia goodfellowii]|uniref:Uncharacterized protein YndB with AHSA1/START domain n=1 Tax=Nocardia goodfellowii TaxID=882446 RepID=A0ABS4QPQ9_9NOCA|nr:SRPBCC family protein [Nocardia goodfellowii]MBP2193088.1 uncharacterized protein YndB with AHSA1/START domain [Nocardia goodfellowii]
MGSLVLSKEVPGTPEAVFDTIADPASWESWFSIHRSYVRRPPERLSKGATLVSRVVVLGMDNEFEWTVEEFDEPHQIVLLGSGTSGVRSEFTYWLRPTETGTNVTVGGVFTGPLITTVLSSVLERHGHDELGHTLDRLAALPVFDRH